MKKRFLGMLSISLPATLLAFMFVEIAVRYPCSHGTGFHSYIFHAAWMLILSIVNAVVLKGRKEGVVNLSELDRPMTKASCPDKIGPRRS